MQSEFPMSPKHVSPQCPPKPPFLVQLCDRDKGEPQTARGGGGIVTTVIYDIKLYLYLLLTCLQNQKHGYCRSLCVLYEDCLEFSIRLTGNLPYPIVVV